MDHDLLANVLADLVGGKHHHRQSEPDCAAQPAPRRHHPVAPIHQLTGPQLDGHVDHGDDEAARDRRADVDEQQYADVEAGEVRKVELERDDESRNDEDDRVARESEHLPKFLQEVAYLWRDTRAAHLAHVETERHDSEDPRHAERLGR